MASKSYFNDEQRKRVLAGKSANPEAKQQLVRKITASLDKDSLRELKDINDNTLETALNTLETKEEFKTFNQRFMDKFEGLGQKLEDEKETVADQLPDFVGPVRPTSMSDNSSSETNVNISQSQKGAGGVMERIAAGTVVVGDLLAQLVMIAEGKQQIPHEEPTQNKKTEPVIDRGSREKRRKEKDDDKFRTQLMKMMATINGGVSSILSKFIGYSVEAIANMAKWVLLIGALIVSFDILKETVSRWFHDILDEGQSSKELFGSYFNQVKKITQSIDDGLQNFDMKDLGTSLSNLFIKPMGLLGETIKTAITEGIGKLIYALGEYTNSDSLKGAGRAMQITALRDKQAAGLQISPENMKMLVEDQVPEAQDKATKSANELARLKALSNQPAQGEEYGAYKKYVAPDSVEGQERQKYKDGLQRMVDQAQKDADAAKDQLSGLQSALTDTKKLQALTDQENAANRQRIADADKQEATTKQNRSEIEKGFKTGEDILAKPEITQDDRKTMENFLQSMEEKNSQHKLNEQDRNSWSQMLNEWQNRNAAIPDSSAGLDPKPVQSSTPDQSQASNNIQVNNSTVNNQVNRSIQRTERKPLVGLTG